MAAVRTIPLSASQQRDVKMLLDAKARALAAANSAHSQAQEYAHRISLYGRAIVGGIEGDVDIILGAGWDIDLTDAVVGIVMTPPPSGDDLPPTLDRDM